KIYSDFVKDLFVDTYDTQHGELLRGRPRIRFPKNSDPSEASDGDDDDDDDDDDSPIREVEKVPAQRPTPEPQAVSSTIEAAWKERGKDLHLLTSLMTSFNALKVPMPASSDEGEGDGDEEANRAVQDFVDSAILLDEIRKDVLRTHPDLAFFLDPTDDLGNRRYAALERILFVWAKYNKGVRYVQGMNEIIGAIYYVLAKDWKEAWSSHAESDAYFLFNALLSEMGDVFISELDDAETGIRGRLAHMQELLDIHDPEVKMHLDELEIDSSYYAFRWWTTLLSREFLLPDTIRLWDSMFASTHKDNFTRYICVTMVLLVRDNLLKGDFAACIGLLQNYPPAHMDTLIEASKALWVYETQVTLA
ncbi:MAG: TBC domain-containing protein, partial [Bacteroidota bacterium]